MGAIVMEKRPILEMNNISKSFPGVKALIDVNFEVNAGEVVILVGENGAGKSTLMKIIAGVHPQDQGAVIINGEEVRLRTPHDAKMNGISIVYQEQALIPDLNAIENIFIGEEETTFLSSNVFGVLDRKGMRRKAAQMISDTFEIGINLDIPVSRLSLIEKQIVEIIRAVIHDARILILDEPTASLEDAERDHLFKIIRKLQKLDVGIIYCSHYLEECIEIGDRIVALRDGFKVGDCIKKDVTVESIIEMMIGKSISEQYPKAIAEIKPDPILEVSELTSNKQYKNISFELFPGEILGIAGLTGSGKNDLTRSIFGINRYDSGTICVGGKKLPRRMIPATAMKHKIAFLPADRKTEGLFLDQPLYYNISLVNLKNIMQPWIRFKQESKVTHDFIDRIKIKTTGVDVNANTLSGGNQQKVMIARWMFNNPDILIFEEPTRGIDVNAKVEVYKLIGEFVQAGGSVIIVSTDVQELEGISDRVLVMKEGEIAAVLSGEDIKSEKITYYSVTHFAGEKYVS